ncbi:hypothetical protein M3A49_11045 [Paraburkholderia sp. CNPSo 3076]|uniref:hypothetical protein n=1 Tax=Paraburkholderia sp. CNPSo 3076 TaxID=2940936 RepID=UPI0022524EE4|nr:hypothetical protein [Paraburkholderia sp. CNPSo 3076]MCX5540024.1 hypothetical protein [Paraburkholderia sp. CNPSo 3076]
MTLNPTCVAVQIPRKHSPASGVNCRYLDYHTSTVYNIPFQALCVAQIMPQARSLQEFAPLAREAFRRWLQRSFFCNTGEYDGATWLNRHLFAHGSSSLWQQSANFSRIVVALTTVGAIESWHDQSNRVSLFFPEMNDDGKLLWQQALFQATAQSRLKLIEQQTYQKHGRLVPEMPTDNGALLRKAKLSGDCIKDLVRPLRNALHYPEDD